MLWILTAVGLLAAIIAVVMMTLSKRGVHVDERPDLHHAWFVVPLADSPERTSALAILKRATSRPTFEVVPLFLVLHADSANVTPQIHQRLIAQGTDSDRR
jgi:hypothetical protein